MSRAYVSGLAALVAFGISCSGIEDVSPSQSHATPTKHEEARAGTAIHEIRRLAEGPVSACGDDMAERWYADLQSDDIEKACDAAIWGTGVRYSELMSLAGLSFSPGGGYWRKTREKVDERYMQEAGKLGKARKRLHELCGNN